MQRIVDGEMKTTTLLTLYRLTRDEIAHVNHVAEFADIATCLHTLEEILCLLIEHVETVPRSLESEVTTHDTNIVGHYLAHFLHTLRNEHLLFVGHSSFVIPLGYLVVEVVKVNMLNGVLCCSIGINNSLDERVASQTIATMKSCA